MTRPTNAANIMPLLSDEARRSMSDAERAARGRAQIAAGDYIEGDELDAFLDSLVLPADEV